MSLPAGVPFLAGRHVLAAVDPAEAVEAVRRGFVAHAEGRWHMPPKVYVPAPPDGDFRAMPAAGDGYAVLKWINSFPRNPELGLPTVAGVLLLSETRTGRLLGLMDAASVTALRTGAAAVLAAETLARPTVAPATVVGSGVNGKAVARTFLARRRDVLLWDAVPGRADGAAAELGEGAAVARDLAEALAADVVVTVTPGHEILFDHGSLHAGQHVSLMGADGPGKAEIAPEELHRARVVCDEWEQARHNGDLARAVDEGLLRREDVAELGHVLLGLEPGRTDESEITVFDSTGLAVQDLAIAITVYERYARERGSEMFAGVVEMEVG
jgi:alanine dehydrogenase